MTSSNWERVAAVVVSITTTAALAVLCVRGLYLRWFADDYWIGGAIAKGGFWGGQAHWYRVWSGRYVFSFVVGALEFIGPRTCPILVTLATLGTLAALRTRLLWPPALAMAWAILLGTSDLPQSVLWQTGLFSYTIPLAAFAWWLGNASGREEGRWFDFIVPILSGGCSEVGALTQVAVCAIAFVAWRRRPLFLGFLGSLVSLGIMAAAPGNAARKAMYPSMPSLSRVIETTAADAGRFLVDTFAGAGIALLLVFLASALFVPRVSRRLLIVTVLCAIASLFVSFAASEATLVLALPQRARIVPYAFLVAAMAAFGASIPWREKWRAPLAAALVFTAIAPLVTAVQLTREIPQARAFAARWDRFDTFLRANPGREVFVDDAPGTVGTLLFLGHDPHHIVNQTMSETYGLRALVRMPPYRGNRLVIGPLPKDAVRYRFD